jgi:hypothetical protein
VCHDNSNHIRIKRHANAKIRMNNRKILRAQAPGLN